MTKGEPNSMDANKILRSLGSSALAHTSDIISCSRWYSLGLTQARSLDRARRCRRMIIVVAVNGNCSHLELWVGHSS